MWVNNSPFVNGSRRRRDGGAQLRVPLDDELQTTVASITKVTDSDGRCEARLLGQGLVNVLNFSFNEKISGYLGFCYDSCFFFYICIFRVFF